MLDKYHLIALSRNLSVSLSDTFSFAEVFLFPLLLFIGKTCEIKSKKYRI